MNCFKKCTAMAVLVFALAACSDAANPKEEAEIKTMDSTSEVVKEQKDKLDEQTKKVEESLEKLDNEFDTSSN